MPPEPATDHPPAPPATPAPHYRPEPTPAPPTHPPAGRSRRWRRPAIIAAVVVVLGVAAWYLVPIATRALNTVSTDDAYVNGHVTFVAPRVGGQVLEVRVDENNVVRKGDVLVRLDPEPYRVQLEQRQAALTAARSDYQAAVAGARATEAEARSLRWKLQTAMEQVDNQVAQLHANIAALRAQEANLERARADFRRAEQLVKTQAMSQEEFDLRQQNVRVAEAQVRQALETVNESRVSLGIPAATVRWDQPNGWDKLGEVPPNLRQTFSGVRQALAALVQAVAQLGVPLVPSESTPDEVIKDFIQKYGEGSVDVALQKILDTAPSIIQARAKVLQAERDVEQAELNLRYCTVEAEIDGAVTRRNVNPGNYVQPGQQLMAVRSLTEIWVDCNFKETQIAEIRIGHPVELYADMYGDRVVYKGRVTGFAMGTGSTLSLLPAQNATGNFVKVVQRLPVRVDLTEPPPADAPLFVGLSIIPYVYFKEPPSGPNAGQFLQAAIPPGGPTTDQPTAAAPRGARR